MITPFTEESGLIHEISAPRSSCQNGSAKKSNAIIQRKIKLMMSQSMVSGQYWTHALSYAVYLNNSIVRSGNSLTPYEIIRSIKVTHKSLPAFGALTFGYDYNIFPSKIFNKSLHGLWD